MASQTATATAIVTHIDARRLERALQAGIAHVLSRRDHLNRINVFPVADSDTGTNLAFTLASVRAVLEPQAGRTLPELLEQIAAAAIDGARGNSGAILAQYFQGLSESGRDYQVLDATRLASVATAAARSAWDALSDPVAGTLPTVLEDFAEELSTRSGACPDLRELFDHGLKRARHSLALTPKQLPVLRNAGVVDAGAQGFVDLLDGVARYVRGVKVTESIPPGSQKSLSAARPATPQPGEHRFCTECVIEADELDPVELRRRLETLPASSLVVAGGGRRARIHIHTDEPGEVFRICNEFGRIHQQKADDMLRQHGLMNQRGPVSIVTDSAADLPAAEVDRLGIHVVPVRLAFDDEEFLDKLTISPAQFYRRLARTDCQPRTSQPPPADFRRQFELLTSHGLEVLSLHISGALSGTRQAAETAAGHIDSGQVQVFDTLNAASGQGLMVLWAAEAAMRGWERVAIAAALVEMRPCFGTFALIRDLSWGVRGGRVRPWMHALARRLAINPVLTNTPEGRLGTRGVIAGQRHTVAKFGRYLLRRMKPERVYRIMISHTDALDDARRLRDQLLHGHPRVDACWIEDASPAVGAHAGPGSLIVGLHPWQAPEDRRG